MTGEGRCCHLLNWETLIGLGNELCSRHSSENVKKAIKYISLEFKVKCESREKEKERKEKEKKG